MAEKPTNIDGKTFWDLYFRNKFVELTRNANELCGIYPLDIASGKSQFSDSQKVSVRVERSALAQYPYEGDGRFAEIEKSPKNLQESVRRIIDESYPFREPPPFGSKRMSELLKQASEKFDWPQDASIPPDMFIHSTQSLASPFNPENGQMLNALFWLSGEQRQRSCSKAIVSTIEQSQPLPNGHKHKIPASVENTAYEALWKINDKSCCVRLLKVMDHSSHSGRLKCAALFKRLLSTTQLLSLEAIGENYYSVGYWEEVFKPYAAYSDIEWDRYDTRSLFWEIRYLAATRLNSKNEALTGLLDDEVSLIRELAKSKLAN